MKTSKLLTLIVFFLISTSNLFADITSCPGLILDASNGGLDGTTTSRSVSGSSIGINGNTTHYFYFTPAVDGTVQVTGYMNKSYNSLYIKDGCGANIWSDTGNSNNKSSTEESVSAGQQIVIAYKRRYSTNASYNITISFTAIDPRESCPGAVIANLDGTATSATDSDSGTLPAWTKYYYNFTPSVDGTIQVDSDVSKSYNSLFIKNGCGANLWSDTADSYTKSSSQINVVSGQQIVIVLYRRYSTTANFNIDFTFEAASPPAITPSTFSISENALIGDSVGTVVATNNPTSYTMPVNAQFDLDSNTGEITVKSALDYETQTTYTLAITATNGVGDDTQNITINIIDELPPTASDQTFNVDETSANGTLLGTILASGNPTDYSIGTMFIPNATTTNPFALNNSNGKLTVNNTSLLDATNIPQYVFEVTISSSEGSVDINVTVDVSSTLPTGNDNTRNFTNVSLMGSDSISINGNILLIGNQLLCKNSSDGAACTAPSVGVNNNSVNQHQAKIDTSSGAPSNNTWAKLTLEDGSGTLHQPDEVIFARLYWSARIYQSSVSDVLKNQARTIKIKGPTSSTYTSLTSPVSRFNWFKYGNYFDYAASQDVTAYVKANGAGNYSVGGITASNGSNRFASWALIVIVQNPDRELNNLSIYDGFKALSTGSGYPSSVIVPASGFLTPVGTEPFKASLFVFTGESESVLNDTAQIQDSSLAWHSLHDGYNDTNDVFNASIYTPENGFRSNNAGQANPNFKNVVGTDIDKLEVNKKADASKQFLDNSQTSTNIKITSGGDRYTLNMFAFETELHYPRLCYDYSYTQNGYVFTELNDGTQSPNIDVPTNSGSPITVTIYLKSLDNDVNFDHVSIYSDFNLSQVRYDGSFQRTLINTFGYKPVENERTSSNCNESSNTSYSTCKTTAPMGNFRTAIGRPHSGVLGYPLSNSGSMHQDDFMYFKFDIMPQNTDPLVTPLKLYSDIQYSLASGGAPVDPVTGLPFGGRRMPLCPPSTTYAPEWGIFNVIDSNLNASRTGHIGSRYLNNLLTQVVQRPFSADVVALDPITDPPNTPIDINTSVAIELVDIKGFHDVNISCKEPAVRFSERVYLNFVDENRTQVLNLTTDNAKQDAAYRIWYIHDGNTSHLIENWSAQTDSSGALQSITNLYEQIPDAPDVCLSECGNPATITPRSSACYECLRTYFGYPLCSRDNFAIRPESFHISVKDKNASSSIAVTNNNLLTPINIAAGYNYTLDINATNHIDSNNTFGYSIQFLENIPTVGSYANFEWLNTGAVCNNELNNSMPILIQNGLTTDYQFSNPDVGRYSLKLRDTEWTTIDQGTPPHHENNEYWLYPNADCLNNSIITDKSLTNPHAYVGCNISSNHTVDRTLTLLPALRYYDINTTFKPYTIDLSNLVISHGPGFDTIFPNTAPFAYVYMNDTTNENNMSLNAIGTILAQGKDGTTLTNYTASCYADDLNFTLETLLPSDGNEVLFQTHYLDINTTNASITSEENNSSLSIAPVDIFHNDANGLASLRVHYNYDNNRSLTFNPAQTELVGINPKQLKLQALNVNCVNAADCALIADQNINYETNGSINIDKSMNFYYGRSHAPRQKFVSPQGTATTPAKAFIYYEVYCFGATCDRSILQDGNDSKMSDDSRWYINTQHTNTYGSANTTTQKGATVVTGTNPTGNAPDYTNLVYTGAKGYPYTTTMFNTPSSWLIYNRFNPAATTNEFQVQFINGNPNWSGAHETDTTSIDGGTSTTNRRVMW